jgi:hypothetical protein
VTEGHPINPLHQSLHLLKPSRSILVARGGAADSNYAFFVEHIVLPERFACILEKRVEVGERTGKGFRTCHMDGRERERLEIKAGESCGQEGKKHAKGSCHARYMSEGNRLRINKILILRATAQQLPITFELAQLQRNSEVGRHNYLKLSMRFCSQ